MERILKIMEGWKKGRDSRTGPPKTWSKFSLFLELGKSKRTLLMVLLSLQLGNMLRMEAQTVAISGFSEASPYCSGDAFILTYTVTGGQFNNGNTMTAQLSSNTGNFGSPVNIGSVTDRNSGSMTVTIPAGTGAGSQYRIRIRTSNSITTSAQSNPITINVTPTITATTPNSRCDAGTVNLGATANVGNLSWYLVASNGTSAGTGTSFTTPDIANSTTYYVESNNNGCISPRSSVLANVYTTPVINSVTSTDPVACPSLNDGNITINATGTNLQYSINGGASYQASNVFNTVGVGTHNIRVRNSVGTSCFVNHTSAITFSNTCLDANKCYDILSYNSTKIVEVKANSTTVGADVVQRTYTDGPHQQWKVVPVGAYHRIVNVNSGLSAEIAGSSFTDGVHVTQNTYTGGNNQQWTFTVNGSNYYIINRNSNKYWDIESASTAEGASLIQWPTHGGNNQRWNMVEVACAVPCATSTSATITPSATTSCVGTPISLSVPAGPGLTYAWTSSSANATISNASVRNPSINVPATAGTYTITVVVSNPNGCSSTSSVNLTFNRFTPTVALAASATTICAGTSVTYTATANNLGGGTATYIFKNDGTTVQSGASNTYTTTALANSDVITAEISISGGSCLTTTTATSNNINMAVTTPPAATIDYAGEPFCRSLGAGQTVTRTGSGGGTYSASPAGLNLAAATGNINPSASTANTYTVTYTIAASGGCPVYTTTTSVTVTTVPAAPSISYPGGPFCSTVATAAVNRNGVAGGTYSSTSGLTIDASSGTITPNSSTGGTYTVTYAYSGGGCTASTTASVTITTLPAATIDYAGEPFCKSLGAGQTVTRTGTTGGTYSSSPAGLSLTAGNGNINPSTSTANTYTVTYTMAAGGGCAQQTATTSVVVTAVPASPGISYSGSPFCTSSGLVNVLRTGVAGGTYSSSPGLNIDASTGTITPANSTGGAYTVNYNYSSGGCTASASANITITTLPSATISYAGTPFCSSVASGAVTRTGTAGGSYSAPAGLSINSSTGTVTPSTSSAGTYTVTYTMAATGGCAQQTATNTVTITTLPSATISYAGSPFCNTLNTGQAVTTTGTSGGTYSAPAGLSINSSTGDIVPSNSTAGTYSVTYTLAAGGGCAQQTTNTSVTVTTVPAASISYSTSPVCGNVVTGQTVTRTGTSGGSYSAPAGLSINATTGTITPNTSTPGTYTVTYTMAAIGGCAQQTATASATVTAVPSATISYAGAPFCSTQSSAQPVTMSGTSGGTYSAAAGLNINASNGEITPSASTAGIYTVTYTIAPAGGCGVRNFNTSVTVTSVPSASISYAGTPFCITSGSAQAVTRTGTSGGSYSAPTGLAINASSGSITPNSSTAGTYTVTYTMGATGGCTQQTATTSVTVYPITTISVQPTASTTICSGGGTSYTVTANGGGTLSYQWRRYGSSIANSSIYSGVNTATLTIANATAGIAGDFSVAVTGACGSNPVISNNANLVVNVPPTITSHPTFQTICEGGAITYEVVAFGGSLTYQWKEDGVDVSNGGIYSGVTTSVLTLTGASVAKNGKNYSVTVSNGCTPNITSNTALLTVVPYVTPAVSIVSSATTVCSGTSVSFTATPGGGGASPSYQWRINGNNVGTNVNPYSSSTLANGDVVSVIMTSNGQCLTSPTATSNNVSMTIQPSITNNTIGNDETFCYNTVPTALAPTATIAGGTGTYAYQWQSSADNVSFADITNATAANYAPAALTSNTYYRRTVSSGTCTSISNAVSKLLNGASFTWVGGTSIDWNTASNWCGNAIPTATDNVTINSGTLNSPTIGAFTAHAKDLNIAAAATLTLSANALLNVTGNWTNNGTVIPQDRSKVRFSASSGTQTIGGSAGQTFFNLEKTAAGTLTIDAASDIIIRRGGLLDIAAGTFDANSRSVLLKSKVASDNTDSTASLGVVAGTLVNASNFKVERYNVAVRGFRYVAAPVTGVTASTFKDSVIIAGPVAAGFDAPNTTVSTIKNFVGSRSATLSKCFVSFTSISTPIVPSRGYYLFVPAKRTTVFPANEPVTLLMKGTPITGKINFDVTYFASASQGWNLLGNPYASAIDWDHPTAWTKTNIDDAIYIWDPTSGVSGGYYSYVSGISSDARDNGSIISSGQGFFVKASSAPALSVTESAKVSSAYPKSNFRTAQPSYITLKVTNQNGDVDYTTVRLDDESGRELSASKLYNGKINIYTKNTAGDLAYSIHAINDAPSFEVPIYIESSSATLFNIEVVKVVGDINTDKSLKIKDAVTGTYTDAVVGAKISYAPDGNTQRLTLMRLAAPAVVTSTSDQAIDGGYELYPTHIHGHHHPVLYTHDHLEKKIEIFKPNGERLALHSTHHTHYSFDDFSKYDAGVYMVKVTAGNKSHVFKIVK